MTKSIVFLRNDVDDRPQTLSENLHYIHYLQKGQFPEIIVKAMATHLPPLQAKAVWSIPDITNAKVLACLMAEADSFFVILPKELFNLWKKALLDPGMGKVQAFSLSLYPDQFQGNWEWALKKSGKILLPLSVGEKEDPSEEIRAILLKKETKIEESLLNLFQNIRDEEAVHKIRVNARTLRSLLDFLKPYTNKELNKKLRNILRDLARELSPIREEDVLMKQIKDFQKKEGQPLNYHSEIQDYLKKLRESTMKELVQTVISQNALAGIPQLKAELQSMEMNQENLAHNINERYYNNLIHFEVQADNNDYDNIESTHDLRKDAKRLRYVLENFNPWINAVDTKKTKHFKKIQSILGDLCDARTNQSYLKNMAAENSLILGNDLDILIQRNIDWELRIMDHLKKVQAEDSPELFEKDIL